ncbi:MAG: arginine--tRNA ligase [Alphaproteobacteria bacterium]|nr:arginine--tRNA ligase [Alphaproteobacteria bacterium]
MLNIYQIFREEFSKIIKEIYQQQKINNRFLHEELELDNFTVEPTKDPSHGDLACNIAMVFCKKFQSNPRDLAQKIITKFNHPEVKKIEIAGAGFINIFLHNNIYYEVLKTINTFESLTYPNIGKNTKVNLEYASPNPTGPIHIGHTRGAIYGDVLAKLLQKVGFDVLKEYYINDAGVQINTLLKSAYYRYLQAFGQNSEIPEGLYPGEYLIEIGQKLKNKFSDDLLNQDPQQYLPKIRDFVINEMLELIKNDLASLGIVHDSYFSEKKNLHDTHKIDETIELLKHQDLIYIGKLEAPKTEKGVGALPEGYDDQEQTLFRSSKFGDDQDRVVKKADGSPTYFGADLAYINSKFERGAKIFIMPLGFDHAGYVKRLTSATNAITKNQAQLKIILCQMVKFVKNGEPLKMSKRAGNFITAKQVIDEVGSDVLRFIMLTRKNDAPFDFDLDKVIEQSKDNPIFYVQYAHTRCCSIIRNLANECPKIYEKIFDANSKTKKIANFNFVNNLRDESEINILKKLASYPRSIEMAVANFEPHRLAFYLQELSSEFHALWNKGSENTQLKFILKNDETTTLARIYIVLAVRKIISQCLEIFNIKALEEMH